MRILGQLLCLLVFASPGMAEVAIYEGSTPAHDDVRKFLKISLTDSIDFIKWQLAFEAGTYELNCRYGLAKGGTDGFSNEKKIRVAGKMFKKGYYYTLDADGRRFSMIEINPNLLHLLDKNNSLLVGNGGYSYTLNINSPVKTSKINVLPKARELDPESSFQGRTPCQELARMMGLNKSAACDKMKWYIIFFADPVTRKPTHYLKGGRAYRRETMTKGRWETFRGRDGRTMYKLDPDKENMAMYLVKVDDNILLFSDSNGNLLVGNKNFSYTLNRIF